jgi:uncharacterized membrane protein
MVSRTVVWVFYAFSLVSGVAGLIYEVAWARMLALTFGGTTLAAAAAAEVAAAG